MAEHRELCQKYMGRFPVIFITLKGVSAGSYKLAKEKLCSVIGREAMRFPFPLDGTRLSSREKEQYLQFMDRYLKSYQEHNEFIGEPDKI